MQSSKKEAEEVELETRKKIERIEKKIVEASGLCSLFCCNFNIFQELQKPN